MRQKLTIAGLKEDVKKHAEEILHNASYRQMIDEEMDKSLYQKFRAQDEDIVKCKCKYCSSIFERKYSEAKPLVSNRYSWRYNYSVPVLITCPTCFRESEYIPSSYEKTFVFYTEENNDFEIYKIIASINHDVDLNDYFGWLKEPNNINKRVESNVKYVEGIGFALWNGNNVSSSELELQKFLYSCKSTGNVLIPKQTCDEITQKVERAKRMTHTFVAERAAKRNANKVDYDALYLNYVPEDVMPKLASAVPKAMLGHEHSTIGNTHYCTLLCPKCEKSFEYKFVANGYYDGLDEEVTCPHCGTTSLKHGYLSASDSSNSMYFENTTLAKDLLIRYFNVRRVFKVETGAVEKTYEETVRVFCNEKKMYVYTNYRGKFQKATVREIPGSYYTCANLQTKEEMRDVIANSCLKWSGLIEACGLGDQRYKAVHQIAEFDHYIKEWYKNNSVEFLVKSNLTALYHDYLRDSDKKLTLLKGKTPAEVLDINPSALRIAVKLNAGFRTLNDIKNLYGIDDSITADTVTKVYETRVPSTTFVTLKQDFGVSLKNAMNYLQTTYDYQCIEKQEAGSLWVDYLRMAAELGMNLSDHSRKYPSSLRKAHDIAMFAYNAIIKNHAENEAGMKKRYEEMTEEFKYSYHDYLIVVPRTVQDIIHEATELNHCLRSYVTRIVNGETNVVFVRSKDEPETPLVTMEIRDGAITQYQGNNNADIDDPDLVEFKEHFAAFKKLKVAC